MGEDKGLGAEDAVPERGNNSNLRRLSCGVGGVELFAEEKNEDHWNVAAGCNINIRETLPRETGFGRALRQSLGSSSFGGGISLRPRMLPNRLPEPPSSAAAVGLNLLPIAHTSSRSAGLAWPSGVEKPEPFRLNDEVSVVSRGAARAAGRLDRQSLGPSESEGRVRSRSPDGPSNRRREESRESLLGGRGPSRLHGLSNLESSSNPPPENPPRSLAGEKV